MFEQNLELLKEYYDNVSFYYFGEKMLKESPERVANFEPYDYEEDNPRIKYKQIVENPDRFEKLYSIGDISIYEERDADDVMLYFIPNNYENVVGHIFYEEIEIFSKQGAFISSIYNNKLYSGLCEKVYFEYFLTKYDFIMSGESQSPRGENFWAKIAYKAIHRNNMFLYVYDGKTLSRINDDKEMKNYYGSASMAKFRFIISTFRVNYL